MADIYSKRDTTAMLGVGYHRPAFPATAEGGKARVVLDRASTVEAVRDLWDERSYLDYNIEATIGAALTAGASWADIGAALGMTRQGAQRRYADARRTYGRQPDEEKARLDKAAGVGRRKIMFEVREGDEGGATVSRHNTAETARKAAIRVPGAEVWKVYPQGRTVRLTAT